jgi:hypothetical protein
VTCSRIITASFLFLVKKQADNDPCINVSQLSFCYVQENIIPGKRTIASTPYHIKISAIYQNSGKGK